jgi:hypothetical protein
MERSYMSGNCEVMVENSAGSQEALPEKLSDLETYEFVGVDGQEYGAVVGSFSLTGEAVSGGLESRTVLPEMECLGDRRTGVSSEYSCSSCGITFGSVMEHIRRYHGGQEVVIEVCAQDLMAICRSCFDFRLAKARMNFPPFHLIWLT